jgi:ABC-type transport system involved in cytochrome bd biosynthesis fused ATPase/permease subunit
MSGNNNNKPVVQGGGFPQRTELMEKFLNLQEQELAQRGRELELRKQSEDHQYQYAKAALDVQSNDAKSERIHRQSQRRTVLLGIGVIVLMVLAFMAYCVGLGKESVAMELIKSAVLLLSGGAGGYAVGARGRSRAEPSDSPESE